jgi:hypothetical protein
LEITRVVSPTRPALGLDLGGDLPGHDVGVGDHEVGCGDPAGTLDAVATGDPGDTHDARSRREYLRVAGYFLVRIRDVRFGAPEAGDRVKPGNCLREERRRHRPV